MFFWTFESRFADKWIIKLLRRLKRGHLWFFGSKKVEIFERNCCFGSLFSSKCSNFSRISVVRYLLSFVFLPHHHFQPCCQLCQEVKLSCIHLFKKLGTLWPVTLNCSNLPSLPDLCLSPSSQTMPLSLLLSPMSCMYLPSVFSPPTPRRH